MSKKETPMTLWYWEQQGGILIEEYPVVSKKDHHQRRNLDGIIILGEEKKRMPEGSNMNLEGKDIIIIQTKNKPLGMSLMGQTLFSKELVENYCHPKSVRSVALCLKTDSILQPLLEGHTGCEVVVYTPEKKIP